MVRIRSGWRSVLQLAMGRGRLRASQDREEIYRLLCSTATAGEAHQRGLRLLAENLSPAQRAQYEKRGYFIVTGGESGRRYRIRYGSQLNVEELNRRGRPTRLLCFLPKGDLVEGDVMLAQKLALELFESEVLKAAREYPPDFFPYLRG
jgi:hypothetical protein